MLAVRVAPAFLAAGARSATPTDDVFFCSARELAALVRSKSISAVELAEAHLRRVRKVNGAINAVCLLDEEGALRAARAADAALASGAPAGPLHGVPITIKDSFDTRGLASTAGTRGRRDFRPAIDAMAVARLRAAGAIILGKTNTPELTLAYETDNEVYGRTNNPFDLSRTPGGSSGGAAAILAAGGSALDLGSDTAGSIRVPAHFCGIAGLKPTYGRVSRAGNILPPGGVIGRQTHVGPMARFVGDLALALSVIAGPDLIDPDVIAMPEAGVFDLKAGPLRVAYFSDNGKSPVESEVRSAVSTTVAALAEAGCAGREARPKGFENADEIVRTLNYSDGGEYYRRILRECGTSVPGAKTAAYLEGIRRGVISGRKYSEVLMEWNVLRVSALRFMADFDLLVCPPCSGVAPKHGESPSLDYSYSFYFNLVGWPTVVLRAGKTAAGLPVGVQIAGPPWKEAQVLAAALHVEKALGGWKHDFPETPLLAAARVLPGP